MAENKKEKTKSVKVRESTHSKVVVHLQEKNEGGDIGKFFDNGALEKIQKEKSKTK